MKDEGRRTRGNGRWAMAIEDDRGEEMKDERRRKRDEGGRENEWRKRNEKDT